MPKRKHREGEALAEWEARKDQRSDAVANARNRVRALSGSILLKPIEAAAFLNVTRKTLREMEARGDLPPRVTFSAKVFGWRLGDMEALVDGRAAAAMDAAA